MSISACASMRIEVRYVKQNLIKCHVSLDLSLNESGSMNLDVLMWQNLIGLMMSRRLQHVDHHKGVFVIEAYLLMLNTSKFAQCDGDGTYSQILSSLIELFKFD